MLANENPKDLKKIRITGKHFDQDISHVKFGTLLTSTFTVSQTRDYIEFESPSLVRSDKMLVFPVSLIFNEDMTT